MLELPKFLRQLESYGGEQQTKLALKLVTLTFLRTTELRAGKWNELGACLNSRCSILGESDST